MSTRVLIVAAFCLSACVDHTSLDPTYEPPPAAELSLSVVARPAIVSVGQDLILEVLVANSGNATAHKVSSSTPLWVGGGYALLTAAAQPASVDIAPGQSHVFSFMFKATDAGALNFEVTVIGVDSGRAPLPRMKGTAGLSVVHPGGLTIETMVVPPKSVIGSNLELVMAVRNPGQATAKGVTPSAVVPAGTAKASPVTLPEPAAMDIPGGEVGMFRWTFRPTLAGAITFAATASAIEQGTDLQLSAASYTSGQVQVLEPASLRIASVTVPSLIARGQRFDVSLAVDNVGGSAAEEVTPAVPVVTTTGGVALTPVSSPAPQSLEPGASATYIWTFVESGSAPGTFRLSSGVQGTDAVGGQSVSAAPFLSNAVRVQDGGALEVREVILPARVTVGQAFTAVAVIRNPGAAVVQGVRPLIVSLSRTGEADATTATAPVPVDLAAGAEARFEFAYQQNGSGAGTLRLQMTATGTDSISNMLLSAAPASSGVLTVETAPALSVQSVFAPANVARGQSFAVSMTVANAGQATATNVVPTGLVASTSGGARVVAQSQLLPVSIPGNDSRSFVVVYAETGDAAGTVSFRAGARGSDSNAGTVLVAQAAESPGSRVQ